MEVTWSHGLCPLEPRRDADEAYVSVSLFQPHTRHVSLVAPSDIPEMPRCPLLVVSQLLHAEVLHIEVPRERLSDRKWDPTGVPDSHGIVYRVLQPLLPLITC